MEWLFGIVILFNFVLIVLETDYRSHNSGAAPAQLETLTLACFGIYCVELGLRLYCYRRRVLSNPWVLLDMVIVGAGAIEYLLGALGVALTGSNAFRAVRLVRLLRLLRAVKLLGALRELRKLLDMMASCMKTLFWSFLLCFLVVTLWSVVAVELLGDIVKDMHDEGIWQDCDICRRYLGSVMHCNLFFFQTVIAGDSWGKISVPVVERHPWSILIFGGALLTIVFGVLNLVVAVVVDTFADLRAKDVTHMARELEAEERAEKKELFKMFEKIDKDKSGELSLQELEHAAQRVPEFRHRLRALDIDRVDLKHLFFLLDRDGSGEIDPEEFIETLYRVKNTESKTATKIMKHYLMHMLPLIAREQRQVQSGVQTLAQTSNSMGDRQKTFEDSLEELHAARRTADRRMSDIRRQLGAYEDVIKVELEAISARIADAMTPPVPHSAAMTSWSKGPPRPSPCSSIDVVDASETSVSVGSARVLRHGASGCGSRADGALASATGALSLPPTFEEAPTQAQASSVALPLSKQSLKALSPLPSVFDAVEERCPA